MRARLAKAKRLFKDKQFHEAKQIILEIIQCDEYQHNGRLLCKLGDICIETLDLNSAQKYYQQSINANPQNATAFLKFGILLHQHLRNHQDAERMYNKCLRLDPTNVQCLFQYANLKQEQDRDDEAREVYLKCLSINNGIACVHYRYAKLLLKDHNNTSHTQIRDLLQRAIDLMPNVAKYHHELAVYLKHNHQYNQANRSYRKALALIHHNDILILYDYAQFLWKCMQNKQEALKYLKMASQLCTDTGATNHDGIAEQCHRLMTSLQTMNTAPAMCQWKVVVYAFDSVLTYWNLGESMNGNIDDMRSGDLKDTFGGVDRLRCLKLHFKRLISDHGVQIVILSSNRTHCTIRALQREGLFQYVSIIIGCDCTVYDNKTTLDHILQLKDAFNIISSKEILYVDLHNNLSSECTVYHVKNEPMLRGLTLQDLEHIESILAHKQYIPPPNHTNAVPLTTISRDLYRDLKNEIHEIRFMEEQLELIPSILWINNNWRGNPDGTRFIEFAHQYCALMHAHRNGHWWHALQLSQRVLRLETTDPTLYMRLAKSLAYLKHTDAADKNYQIAFGLLGKYPIFSLSFSYANHLFRQERYVEAEARFRECLDIGVKRHGHVRSVSCGLARTLEKLGQTKKAEHHYKRGLFEYSKNEKIYESVHFYYGQFLRMHKRYAEAEVQFQICLKCSPNKAINHFAIAQVFYHLKAFEKYEFHVQNALDSDPYFAEARRHWDAYRNKDVIVNDRYNIEFDRFWFDRLGIISDDYNRYYDKCVQMGKNDIRFIAFDKDIKRELKMKIGIEKQEDLDIMTNEISFYRKQYTDFCTWMEGNQLLDAFYPILHKHGILTMESLNHNVNDKTQLETLVTAYEKDTPVKTNWSTLIQRFWTAKRLCDTK
eukprot:204830_1